MTRAVTQAVMPGPDERDTDEGETSGLRSTVLGDRLEDALRNVEVGVDVLDVVVFLQLVDQA
jgi:hypothetical protein